MGIVSSKSTAPPPSIYRGSASLPSVAIDNIATTATRETPSMVPWLIYMFIAAIVAGTIWILYTDFYYDNDNE